MSSQRDDSIPIFILGSQRSGSTMLIDIMHLRSDTQSHSEARNNSAFVNYQLRDLEEVKKLIQGSPARFVCFKPIADSHKVFELRDAFPNSYIIWLYRQYEDVANSRLRKFAAPTRAIKLVCKDLPGGGWFAEGASDSVRQVLRKLPYASLSEFDFACLNWWARNQIFVEKLLWQLNNVILMRYEQLVSDPDKTFTMLSKRIGLPCDPQSYRFINRHSIGRNPAPQLHPEVKSLCDSLMAELEKRCTL